MFWKKKKVGLHKKMVIVTMTQSYILKLYTEGLPKTEMCREQVVEIGQSVYSGYIWLLAYG